MAYDEALASRIRTVLRFRRGTGERQMFGGICFTLNGYMVCGLANDDLMLRVGPGAYQKSLKRPHARPMDFTGRPMVGYVYVAASGIRSERSLRSWLDAAVSYVRMLPPKTARPKRKTVTKKPRQSRVT